MFTKEEEGFFNLCPAWARKLGIINLSQWNVAKAAMPFSWSSRQDYLQSLKEDKHISEQDRIVILRILEYWDEISTTKIC